MMGRQSRQMAMIFVDIESLIPETHLLRKIERMVISHVENLLYATQLFLASTSLQRRISSRHRYSLHMPM